MISHFLRLFSTRTIRGYEHPELVSEVFRKTIGAEPAGVWSEIRGVKTVLDFGGACGGHYRVARNEAPDIRWAVVETAAMVRQASELSTDRLQFFDNIDAAVSWLGAVELMHSNGAIQYTPDPLETARKLVDVGAHRMYWRRLFLSDKPVTERQRSMLFDNGPSGAPLKLSTTAVEFDRKSISRAAFESVHRGYRVEASGPDWFDFVRVSEATCSR